MSKYGSTSINFVLMLLGIGAVAQATDRTFIPEGLGQKPIHLTKEVLLEKKIALDERDVLGRTPLIIAASNGDWYVVKFLIDAGADVNLSDSNGWTPLFAASYHKQPRIVEMLLKAGANPNIPTAGEFGMTPLMAAAWRLNKRIVKLLIDSAANRHVKAQDGSTALTNLEDRKAMVDKDYQYIKNALMEPTEAVVPK